MATNKPVNVRELFGDLKPAIENQKWYVIYTKPKREKKLAEFALQNGINYYLPLIDSERQYQYRKILFTKPMFPGYIFVKCSFDEKRNLVISGHTVSFLNVKNEYELLYDLNQIYFGRNAGVDLTTLEYIVKGTKVRVKQGPMKGLSGIVSSDDSSKIILQIHMLKQAVSLTVDAKDLEVIED